MLTCRKEHGLAFPAGLTPELFEQIRGFDAWLWHALYGKRDFCFNSFHSGVHRIYSHLNDIQEVYIQVYTVTTADVMLVVTYSI